MPKPKKAAAEPVDTLDALDALDVVDAPDLVTVLGPDGVVHVTNPPTVFKDGQAKMRRHTALVLVNDRGNKQKYRLAE